MTMEAVIPSESGVAESEAEKRGIYTHSQIRPYNLNVVSGIMCRSLAFRFRFRLGMTSKDVICGELL
jgi:hypothetical protein